MVEDRLTWDDAKNGVILDGFPRTIEQAEKLDKILAKKGEKIDLVINLVTPEEEIVDKIKSKFDLTPRGIIEYLDLKKPIYRKTTNYGHFGKEDLSWEKVIKI